MCGHWHARPWLIGFIGVALRFPRFSRSAIFRCIAHKHPVYLRSGVSILSLLFQRDPSRAGRNETSVQVNYTDLCRMVCVTPLTTLRVINTLIIIIVVMIVIHPLPPTPHPARCSGSEHGTARDGKTHAHRMGTQKNWECFPILLT